MIANRLMLRAVNVTFLNLLTFLWLMTTGSGNMNTVFLACICLAPCSLGLSRMFSWVRSIETCHYEESPAMLYLIYFDVCMFSDIDTTLYIHLLLWVELESFLPLQCSTNQKQFHHKYRDLAVSILLYRRQLLPVGPASDDDALQKDEERYTWGVGVL